MQSVAGSRSSGSVGTGPLLITLAVVLLMYFCIFPLKATAQDMSHEEEVVRNAYAKLSLMCALKPLVETGNEQLAGMAAAQQSGAEGRIAKDTPTFALSDFRVGDISTINNDRWGGFVDMAQNGDYILTGEIISHGYSDNGAGKAWQMAKVSWQRYQEENVEAAKLIASQPVSKIIKLASKQWEDNSANAKPPITYTKYVAYSVTATFQGRTIGPHKTIAFIGHDARGNEYIAENDLFTGQNPLWFAMNRSLSIDGLLLGKMREAPVVAQWLRNNVMPAESCSANAHALCCDHGKCGISPILYNRELSVPLPTSSSKSCQGGDFLSH